MAWVVREAEERDAAAMVAFARAVFAEPGIQPPNHADEFRFTVDEEAASRAARTSGG